MKKKFDQVIRFISNKLFLSKKEMFTENVKEKKKIKGETKKKQKETNI